MKTEMVLEKLRSIGYQIRVDGEDILLTADRDPVDPALVTALLAELKRCKVDAVRLLNMAWPAETKTLLEWFAAAPAKEAPFHLSACVRVLDAELFYETLRRDIERGPRGPRARTGALRDDLSKLQ